MNKHHDVTTIKKSYYIKCCDPEYVGNVCNDHCDQQHHIYLPELKSLHPGITHDNPNEHEHGIETGTRAADHNAHLFYAGHADGFGADYFNRYLQDMQDGYNREQYKIVVKHVSEIDVQPIEQAEEYQE